MIFADNRFLAGKLELARNPHGLVSAVSEKFDVAFGCRCCLVVGIRLSLCLPGRLGERFKAKRALFGRRSSRQVRDHLFGDPPGVARNALGIELNRTVESPGRHRRGRGWRGALTPSLADRIVPSPRGSGKGGGVPEHSLRIHAHLVTSPLCS